MAVHTSFSQASAKAALDALLLLLNTGGTGYIKIFEGTLPANTEAADAGTLLGQLSLSADGFPNSSTITSPFRGAEAVANAIADDTDANATGTAQYFRAYSGAGTCIIQGTCGTATADMILATVAIVIHATISITAWTVRLPDGD